MSRATESGGAWSKSVENKTRLNETKRAWYHVNREKVLAANRRDYPKQKQQMIDAARRLRHRARWEALDYYSNGTFACACCGETTIEFLSIDHINGGGNKQRTELKMFGNNFTLWLRRKKFPVGFQVLCHNCNQAKGYYVECPHKSNLDTSLADSKDSQEQSDTIYQTA